MKERAQNIALIIRNARRMYNIPNNDTISYNHYLNAKEYVKRQAKEKGINHLHIFNIMCFGRHHEKFLKRQEANSTMFVC